MKCHVAPSCFVLLLSTLALAEASAEFNREVRPKKWQRVYSESFDRLPAGTTTASKGLLNWEGGSASGVVFNGKAKVGRKFLIAESAWTSFNQGPILNVDLSATPHDRVRVQFDLYTFGDWRGIQKASGGPQHRLMFFDNKAEPAFSFDTNFSTNSSFSQSWPERNPAVNKPLKGCRTVEVDTTGRFNKTHRWPIQFEYPSESSLLRFTILCGAAAGSGKPMPRFGIDNVRVSVRSTAPVIELGDREQDVQLAAQDRADASGTIIPFKGSTVRRHSLAVFSRKTGQLVRTLLRGEAVERDQIVAWDGLDNRGRIVPEGEYEWRSISSEGLTARYITTIGINPPGGEHKVPRRSWVGDHVGAGIVDVDESGIYVGSPTTEGLMMLAKVDASKSGVVWTREQFYQSGRMTRAATSGQHVYILHPNGKLRRLNKDNGRVEAEWQIASDGKAPGDVDASGKNLAVADGVGNRIRWLSTVTGQELAAVQLAKPVCIAAMESLEKGEVLAASGIDIFRVRPGDQPRKVAALSGSIGAMDYDPVGKELWVVVDEHRVVRLDQQFQVAQTYSDEPRELGPFEPTRFAGVYDIAADLNGGFFVGEPSHPPRRVAHIARDGSLIDQWFGGMSFYVGGTFDPEDPTRLIGIAPEGFVNVYRIDYEAGTWEIEASYATGRLGDSLFPHAGSFRAVRRDGQLYLYHRVVPAVLRLDPQLRQAVPVAIAGRVINKGRTFFQFAGTGRDGFPQSWVAAAEHHGYRDLEKAPGLYSWADSNGDGKFDPVEFRFYPNAKRGLSFHNPGDFTSWGDYIGSTKVNEPHALLQLPVSGWEGPRKDAPRWSWDRLETAGEIIADSFGYGSPRGVSVSPDGRVSVVYQAGIMIRGHGQYEGGGWPEAGLRGARVLGFDSKLRPQFAVGRHSKHGTEVSTGVLYYPMQTTAGPNRTVVVNDQTKQAAQVWTHDGLYVGSVFDHRADDGFDDAFYKVHGDDNQGATIVTTKQGNTFWLMPYQAHNRLYEVTGWNGWQRQSGTINRPAQPPITADGTGLRARYYRGSQLALEAVEPPIYYEQFGAERHADKLQPHYKVDWSGILVAPLSDNFQFSSLLGKGEQLAVWLDGRLIHVAGFGKSDFSKSIALTAGHRHRIHIEYINPEGRAELKLLWCSRVTDLQRIPATLFHPID